MRSQELDCSTHLQQLVDAATAGSVISVPACIYRETVTISRPLSLLALPGAEIRGSDVWTAWKRSGNFWTSADALPEFFAHGECSPESNGRCLWAEQVFYNGQPLYQVASSPTPGQFAVDSGRRVVLADDPTGQTVEVTTRRDWIGGSANDVTIQGFRMAHAANDAQTGAITPTGSRWTLQGNTLSDTHGAVVSLVSNDNRLLTNDIFRGGQLGVHGSGGSGNTIQGNTIHDNNTEQFDGGWEAGGVKTSEAQNLVVDGNEVYNHPGAPGLWCDGDCTDITYTDNRVHHNGRAGIFFEISDGAHIHGNRVWENGWDYSPWGWGAGILVASSANAEVYGNIVAWNADGISIISADRGEVRWNTAIGNYVHDNCILKTDDDPADNGSNQVYALAWLQDWSGVLFDDGSANRGASNAYWYPDPEGATRYAWNDVDYNHLDAFNGTPGEEGGRYLGTTEKDALLLKAQMPLAPERVTNGATVIRGIRPRRAAF